MKKEATLKNIEAVKCRSAWSKGVKEYAYMLLDNILSYSDYKAITNFTSLHEELLNGASNWDAYDLNYICLINGNRSFPKHRRLPESAKQIIKEYEKKSTDATFDEQSKLDKKYLDKFIEALSND